MIVKFYDLQGFSNISVGKDSVKTMAEVAKKLGYEGIAISDEYQGMDKIVELIEKTNEATAEIGIDVVPGVTINVKTPAELKEILSKVREKVPLVIVHGGNYLVNRAACEDSRVDVLIHPELGRIDNGLDDTCMNSALKNNVAIGMSFSPILETFRRPRSLILQNIATNLRLVQEFGAKLVICSGARSKWDLRDPRQLIAVADTIGFELSKGFSALTDTPLEIIIRNKKILSGDIVAEGVELIGEKNA